jgi:hypothetical protein
MKGNKPALIRKPIDDKPRKPRIFIVGGEKRNFKSGEIQDRMDVTIHLKDDGPKIKVSSTSFDIVFGLPWITFTLQSNARAWAKANRIPFVEVPKVGRIEFWLSEKYIWARKYFESLDKRERDRNSVVTEVALDEPVPAPESDGKLPPLPIEPHRWDEDQLWEAYGEEFVNKIKGLDGEITDRKTFIGLMEDETGLKGEPVEILMMILRRQGVISEDTGGIVSIGNVNQIDIEKKKEFIQRSGEVVNKQSIGNLTNSGGRSSTDLLAFFSKLGDGTLFESTRSLFKALCEVGLSHNGKQYTDNQMRKYLYMVSDLGVKREGVGRGVGNQNAFRLRLPVSKDVVVTEAREMPDPLPAQVSISVPAPVPVIASIPAPALQASSVPSLPLPAPVSEKALDVDLSKTGVVYDMVSKSYPEGRIPDLVGLVDPARALRGIFYDSQWNRAAAIGILQRIRIPVSDPNIMRVVQRKLDFTEDEWSWFSIEYLRDQTLMSLLPIIVVTNELWRVCRDCSDTFSFHVPGICWTCKGISRKTVENSK